LTHSEHGNNTASPKRFLLTLVYDVALYLTTIFFTNSDLSPRDDVKC
jgi:hypothetical protein